ncbi:MAG TPA: EAL domain-containing protein [Dehalococcoidia bacterium]|nr:EAL domain-containing protein [Dehalococcoidia bacterium]
MARLVMAPESATISTLIQACAILRAELGAEEVYVVQAGEPYFTRMDGAGDPTAYELKQKGYFLVWHELVKYAAEPGGLFQVRDRLVFDPSALRPDAAATHLAMLLPGDETLSEMLVVHGPWPAGLTVAQVNLLIAVRPLLAYLIRGLLDEQQRDRQRSQLHSLSAIASVLTREQELETALPALATALANAASFDWVTLTLVNETLDAVTARALNAQRFAATGLAANARDGDAFRAWALENARRFAHDPRPILYPDLFDGEHERPLSQEMREHYLRSHLNSLALFPLQSGERLLGTISFSATAPHRFDPAELALLQLLADQTVVAIEWLEMHGKLRDANVALARAAAYDGLTGLPNRGLFSDRLAQTLARQQRTGGKLAVLFVDLDGFKQVNDTLGHHRGDQLLKVIAERLSMHVRGGDTAARLGGDEFVVLLEEVGGEDEAAQAAERLLAEIRQPVELDGHRVSPSASIGLVCCAPNEVDADRLVREADLAMYHAKSSGKGRIARYERGMLESAELRLQLEAELQKALEGGQFRLHYQPIVTLGDEEIVELEALVRWEHPELGLLPPAQFLPLAEAPGLIVPLGRWVLREACRQAAEWRALREGRPLVVAVNLSARQLIDSRLEDDVLAALAEAELPPWCLRLELSEATVRGLDDASLEPTLRLHQRGVRLAIDDFGADGSSLAQIERLPADTLKLDRSFVVDAAAGETSPMLAGILALARSRHLAVTAVGIESPEQLACMRELGCERGQGYLIARPLEAEQLTALLAPPVAALV